MTTTSFGKPQGVVPPPASLETLPRTGVGSVDVPVEEFPVVATDEPPVVSMVSPAGDCDGVSPTSVVTSVVTFTSDTSSPHAESPTARHIAPAAASMPGRECRRGRRWWTVARSIDHGPFGRGAAARSRQGARLPHRTNVRCHRFTPARPTDDQVAHGGHDLDGQPTRCFACSNRAASPSSCTAVACAARAGNRLSSSSATCSATDRRSASTASTSG